MKRSATRIIVLLAALGMPGVAHAHLVNSGLGPVYDGALHLVLNPMDVVRLLTLSLFAGAQAPRVSRAVVVAAPVGWFLAGIAGFSFDAPGAFAVANGVSLFLLGAAVALDLKAPVIVAAMLAALFGGLFGFQSGVDLQADNADWVALLGASAVVLVLLLVVTSLVASATAFALRIICRVLGSWAAATGLLSIGWIIAASR